MAPATALVKHVPTDEDIEVEGSIEARVKLLSQEFGRRIVDLVSTAAITVTDKRSCESAVALRSTIGQLKKEIEEKFEDKKAYYFKKHRDVCAEENKLLGRLVDPKNPKNQDTIDGKLYVAIQEWTEAEDKRRLEEEQRIAEEQQREAQDRALAEAAHFESAGQYEMAAAVVEESIAAPAPVAVLPNVRSEVKGLKTKPVWRWRFTGGPKPAKDILKETPAVVLSKAMGLLPREYLMPDVKSISGVVDALHNKTKIPGVEVYCEQVPIR